MKDDNVLKGYHFIKVEEDTVSVAYRPNIPLNDWELERYKYKSVKLTKKVLELKQDYIEYFI